MEGDDGGRELVEVAYGKDRVEAEMIQGLLENAGIPCLLQQAVLNVDGPQLGFALLPRGFGGGPQRVMVHAIRADSARGLLEETFVEDEETAWLEIANATHLEDAGARRPRGYGLAGAYARILLWSFGVLAVVFGVFLVLRGG
ncbi:MAG: DUF2007 domain-containing protein [Thermoleophilia bacterium]|nr:DUF2007 domain-containing protein [Thermoleophilia bacterium]